MADNVYKFKKRDGKSVPAHIVIAEMYAGRKLEPNEVVHHKNGDKSDNRPENLQIMDRAEHTRLHKQGAVPSRETIIRLSEGHKGKISANRKLTDEQVMKILDGIKAGKTYAAIAQEYNISAKTVRRIAIGDGYKNITEEYAPEVLASHEKTKLKAPYLSSRKLSAEDISWIRVWLKEGYAVTTIAENYGVGRQTIRDIRDGKSYKDIPEPELIASYRAIDDIHELADIMLCADAPIGTEPEETLINEYGLYPTRNAMIIFRLFLRALNGNAEDALLLFAISRHFNYMIEEIYKEESIYYRAMHSGEESK